MRGHGGGVASPYGPRERRRGAGLQVGGRSADQRQVEAPGDLRGNTGRPGEPLGNGHQRGGVVRRERGAGVVGGLGARWEDHRLHAQRTGEVRRRRQRPVVAFDPGIGPCQALGGGCRIGDRLEGMERAEAPPRSGSAAASAARSRRPDRWRTTWSAATAPSSVSSRASGVIAPSGTASKAMAAPRRARGRDPSNSRSGAATAREDRDTSRTSCPAPLSASASPWPMRPAPRMVTHDRAIRAPERECG